MPGRVYTITYKRSVEKELRKLSQTVRIQVVEKIQALAKNPHPTGSVKLRGAPDLYRIRHADYRIIYEVINGELIILVIKIGHRREVYREY